ncbi:hypothetical protein [Halorarius halobius]|uniref:hypothetical protein n=1 Tax=Halorarius halobius TaxID=2962671 RepID=UPI0020CD8711|nr:hypothetical protein [Halorarius halobius]
MRRLAIERQERDVRRDGGLFLVGLGALLAVELVVPSTPLGTGAVHGFLRGCSLGLTLSGVFRATDEQAAVSTLALGIGFAVGAVVELL